MSNDGEFLVFLDDPPPATKEGTGNKGGDEFLYILDGPEAVEASADVVADDDKTINVTLAEDVSIENIAGCYRQLAAVEMRESTSVVVDMSAVKKVDTAFMQLLSCFRRRCDAKLVMLTCKNVSQDVTELAELLDYSSAL